MLLANPQRWPAEFLGKGKSDKKVANTQNIKQRQDDSEKPVRVPHTMCNDQKMQNWAALRRALDSDRQTALR